MYPIKFWFIFKVVPPISQTDSVTSPLLESLNNSSVKSYVLSSFLELIKFPPQDINSCKSLFMRPTPAIEKLNPFKPKPRPKPIPFSIGEVFLNRLFELKSLVEPKTLLPLLNNTY